MKILINAFHVLYWIFKINSIEVQIYNALNNGSNYHHRVNLIPAVWLGYEVYHVEQSVQPHTGDVESSKLLHLPTFLGKRQLWQNSDGLQNQGAGVAQLCYKTEEGDSGSLQNEGQKKPDDNEYWDVEGIKALLVAELQLIVKQGN